MQSLGKSGWQKPFGMELPQLGWQRGVGGGGLLSLQQKKREHRGGKASFLKPQPSNGTPHLCSWPGTGFDLLAHLTPGESEHVV